MIQINCTIVNITTSPVLNLANGHNYIAELESSNRAIFRVNDVDHQSIGNFLADGQVVYRDYVVPSLPGAYEGPVLELKPLVEELHIIEDQFLLPDGTNYNWKGSIDWMLYKRSLDGQDIEALLAQRFIAGSRCVATLMQAHFIERFYPSEYGQRYYDHMIPFAQALKRAGFYWMPVVYADEQVVKSGHDFVYQVASHLHDMYWVLPSLGNEWSKNGFNPGDFVRPNTNNLWSRGSNVGDEAPWYPSWDWKEWHPRRDWPKVLFGNDDMWYVKEGINADNRKLDKRAPCIASEPIGFWDHDVPNRRSNDPNLARVIGGTSIYFGRGANFMSEQGLRCELWDSITYNCAVEFFKAINQ
jgi:hypothetical protein